MKSEKRAHYFFILALTVFYHVFMLRVRAWAAPKGAVDVNTEITNLKNKDVNKKLAAVQNLRKSKDEKVVKELIKTLKTENDSFIKIQVIDSLNVEDSTAAFESVMLEVDDKNPEVRKKALLAVSKSRNTSQVIRKIENFWQREKNKGVKLAAVNILKSYSLNLDDAIRVLGEKALKDEDSEIRFAAVKALKVWNKPLGEVYLKERLKNEKDQKVIDEIKR